MNISLYPPDRVAKKCLVLVGGDGDGVDVFAPLVNTISQKLSSYQICTFDFTESSSTSNVLDIQTRELESVFQGILDSQQYQFIDIWTTSRGAYSTTRLLSHPIYSASIRRVIMYDPADYYIDNSDIHSWAGYKEYLPTLPVISDEIQNMVGEAIVDMVHLSLRNYGPEGYIDEKYENRGIDHEDGYPRLNTKMVKSFYDKLPGKNKGKYLLENRVPHGFVRDGNISQNYEHVADLVHKILS